MSDKMNQMIGKKLTRVMKGEDPNRFGFACEDGSESWFDVEGDCCSHSWVESIDVAPGAIGSIIREYEDDKEVGVIEEEYDCLRLYNFRVRTDKGDIVVDFRNSSNGYYGGNVVTADRPDSVKDVK